MKCGAAVPFHECLSAGPLADRIILCVNACRGLSDEDLGFVIEKRAELGITYFEEPT